MIVCIVLIWFIMPFAPGIRQPTIFKVKIKINNTISKLVLVPTPPPPTSPFLVKSQLFEEETKLTLSFVYLGKPFNKRQKLWKFNVIRNLEPNCEYSCSSSSSSEIVAFKDFIRAHFFSLLGPPLNIWPLKTFVCVSLRYIKRHWVVGDNKTKSK